MFAIVTWYDGVSGLLATVQPLVFAISGILWGSQFWLFTTNWRGRAKRQWEKPTWGNRHPMAYARPQSRFIQAAARFLTPPVILADLLVIGLVLIR